MTKVALIDFVNVYSFSVRSISSYIKSKGFDVVTVHCRSSKNADFFSELTPKSLQILYDLCKDYDIVGISLLSTHYLKRAIQINNYLKERIEVPIIWGGVPVMCDPAFYLKYADFICAGEGEIVMTDLLSGKDPTNTPGIWYRTKSGEVIQQSVPPLLDLNDMPIPYFDFENTYIMKGEKVASLKEDPQPLYTQSKKGYRIFPIRGCPFSCTFCSNNQLKEVFKEKVSFLRHTKPENIINELKNAKKIIPSLNRIMFYEDDFMVRKDDELKELLDMYTHEIALPFNINATIQNINEKKINMILDRGNELEFVKIGIQAANKRINKEVFKRYFNKKIYLDKLDMLASKGVPAVLDIISDNPYETMDDKHESVLFLKELSRRLNKTSTIRKPVKIMDHKLMYYPGTSLYNRALKDGIINGNYINNVLLSRSTTRIKSTDFDNDAFILALFKTSVKNPFGMIAYLVFVLCGNKNIFIILYKSNIFKFIMRMAIKIKRLFKF